MVRLSHDRERLPSCSRPQRESRDDTRTYGDGDRYATDGGGGRKRDDERVTFAKMDDVATTPGISKFVMCPLQGEHFYDVYFERTLR